MKLATKIWARAREFLVVGVPLTPTADYECGPALDSSAAPYGVSLQYAKERDHVAIADSGTVKALASRPLKAGDWVTAHQGGFRPTVDGDAVVWGFATSGASERGDIFEMRLQPTLVGRVAAAKRALA